MDDVVDLEEEKINKILEKIDNDPESEEIKATERNLWLKIKDKLLKGRRTGLSGIGIADTLAMLNLGYIQGTNIAVDIYKHLAIAAYKSSIDMARDRGAFLNFNYELEKNNPFVKRIFSELSEQYQFDWGRFGRRNIALLTIPPSGTISLLAGISSGVEPIYQLSYRRRRKVDANHPNKSFKDKTGDWWEEYEVLHPGYAKWKSLKYSYLVDESDNPYKGSTAYEINPLDRVKFQASIQQWVDHSISSTINLPKSATEKDVSDLYIEAWKLGCKGITVYRDGSRDGVLITEETRDFSYVDAPKRPKSLKCDMFYITSKGEAYNVLVGLLDNKPYEVFATRDIISKSKHVRASIVKVSRGHYKVVGDVSRDKLMENMSSEEKVITRAISALLRHRANVKFVVETLHKFPGEDMFTFNNVLARILKRYISNNEVVTGSVCENCGSTDLIYKEGCVECQSCGHSKCG